MAKFEIDLRDTNGNLVEFGDIIIVELPEVIYPESYDYENAFYLPGRTIEGILGFQLSRGVVVKVTKIIDGEHTDNFIGKIIKLRYTARDWYKKE